MKTIKDGLIILDTPYNRDFISDLKRFIASDMRKWNKDTKKWEISLTCESIIDDMLYRHFAYIAGSKSIKIIITAKDEIHGIRDSLKVAGKSIVSCRGRDSGAWVGRGTILISGNIYSGGSNKNYYSYCTKGSRFQVEIPESAINQINTEDWDIEIENNNISQDELNKLKEERKALLARLNEIDININSYINPDVEVLDVLKD